MVKKVEDKEDRKTEETAEEVVFPRLEGLPPNTHLWYWTKKEPSDIAPCPSVNYYFRSLEMARYVSDKFDNQHKYINCYSITDMTGCRWWLVHFYSRDEPSEEIHDWCLKNSKNYKADPLEKPMSEEPEEEKKINWFYKVTRNIPAPEGWEKSINNFSEFKKLFAFKRTVDKKNKEIWYIWEKDGKSGYRWEATGTGEGAVKWELRRCFESRTRRTYIADDGKYALVVRNMDWTRFYHLNKIIPTEQGAWTCMDGDGYPGSVKMLFDKKSRRDIVVKALKQWYG